MSAKLSPARKFVRPEQDETLEMIAAKHLPGTPPAEAVQTLTAWNPHLLVRRGNYLLVSDVVFVEPPLGA
jgi:hypothetical protein